MTPRQEYAKAAMQGMLSKEQPPGITTQQISAAAFAMADSMLIHEKMEQEFMEKRRNQ